MRMRFKPSKPQAVFGAVVGVAILAVGIATVHANVPFLIVWCAIVVGIVGMNLWAAFSRNGSLFTAETSDDDRPRDRAPGRG